MDETTPARETVYTQPASITDPIKGDYLTLKEFATLYEKATGNEITIRTLHHFIDNGMPHDPRGGVFFVYAKEAMTWIANHVERGTSYRIIKKS